MSTANQLYDRIEQFQLAFCLGRFGASAVKRSGKITTKDDRVFATLVVELRSKRRYLYTFVFDQNGHFISKL